MASDSAKKFRFVKCPKCLKTLLEDEDVPVYQCGNCSAILQAKRRNIPANSTPSSGERKEAQASELRSKPEHTNESRSSGHDSVSPSTLGISSSRNGYVESMEKQLGGLNLSNEEEKNETEDQEFAVVNSRLAETAGERGSSGSLSADHVMAARASNSSSEISPQASPGDQISPQASPGDQISPQASPGGQISPQASPGDQIFPQASPGDQISPQASPGHQISPQASPAYQISPQASPGDQISPQASPAYQISPQASPGDQISHQASPCDRISPQASPGDQISPQASPGDQISPQASSTVKEEQTQDDYNLQPYRISTDDHPAYKTPSAYDGSESSSEEIPGQLLDETERRLALERIRSGKFEMQNKEQGESSVGSLSEKRRNGTTYRSLQLDGPGGRLDREGRTRLGIDELRPDMPFYPRGPYTRGSPSYPSHDEFDGYSRTHSLPYIGGLQIPAYANHEYVDNMYHNTRQPGRGQGRRFSHIPSSGELAIDRRHHASQLNWYSGQLHNNTYSSYTESPQRGMEPEYYHRWSREVVSDVEDQRHRYAGQQRRLRERQRVAKRHVRPTAGGAPFVSCYFCSANLQLPVDFLIFKRKHHLLRCGTCTSVLRFSLQAKTHLVPVVTEPQPRDEVNAHNSSNLASGSRHKATSKTEKQSTVQDEELPVARGSPLHRLMGYSTVSQVFKVSQRPPSI